MQTRLSSLKGLASGFVLATTVLASAAPTLPAPEDRSFLDFPGHPQIPLPPGSRAFGPSGPAERAEGGNPGVTAPLVGTAPKAAGAKPTPPKTRVEVLDDLFHRLAGANDADEASGVALIIQHVWLQSGSDTADLLMIRAGTAAEKGDRALAIRLLDKVVVLAPTWSEAWNRRATLRFLDDDDVGSMDDIGHVLSLEPRHFGALTGMASILLRAGLKKAALTTLRTAAGIYPHNADIEKLIGELVPDVEGRGI